MDASACRELLARLIAEETATLERLEGLLDREHEFIVANDVDKLERAGDERQVCISALARIEDERRSTCRMLNVSADPAGLEKLLSWCDPSRALLKQWAACAKHAARCRELNDRNGALVTARLRRVEGMLGVITGRSSQPKLYARQGGYAVSGRNEHLLARV